MATSSTNDDPAAKAKAEGKLAARVHDEINLILVTFLVGMTIWSFIAYQPFEDALNARANTIEEILGENIYENENTKRIYFWLDNILVKKANWEEPPIYGIINMCCLIYTVFDTLFLILVPACTNKPGTLIPHHIATLCLTVGSRYLNVKPLTVMCLIVEVNTFVLTIKNIKRSPNVKISRVSDSLRKLGVFLFDTFRPLIEPSFLLSWILFRLFYYPFIFLTFYRYFTHPRFGDLCLAYVLSSLSVLVVLNYIWTYGSMGFLFTFGMFSACMIGLSYC